MRFFSFFIANTKGRHALKMGRLSHFVFIPCFFLYNIRLSKR
ncbi:hypothetical protein [Moraxella lacunata]